jgi:exopolysaccharide biosynthesis WecB/TagA/CpsF family protein
VRGEFKITLAASSRSILLSTFYFLISTASVPITEQILGVRFFNGPAIEIVDLVSRTGGMVVAPAAPSMVNLRYDRDYRDALAAAEFAIADSGWMVLLWKIRTGRRLTRISGFAYTKRLLEHETVRKANAVMWIVPSPSARDKLVALLRRREIPAADTNVYVAPRYARPVRDETLLDRIRHQRPAHIVIAVGGGVQDKLGHYLKDRVDYKPAIHCIGAALGFLTGDQIAIPDWADRLYLGWLVRLFAQPGIFIPRLWRARELPWLIIKYGEHLPPIHQTRI